MNVTYLVGGVFFSLGGWMSVVAATARSRDWQSARGAVRRHAAVRGQPGGGLRRRASPRGSPTAGSGSRTSSAASASSCPGTSRCWTSDRAGSGVLAGDLDWWIVAVNQVGSVLFFLAGLAAFVRPATSEAVNVGPGELGHLRRRRLLRGRGDHPDRGRSADPAACCARRMTDTELVDAEARSALRQPFPDRGRPVQDVPGRRHVPDRRHAPGGRGPRDGGRPAAQPGHVRHHLDGAGGAAADRREPAPQLHRPRGVPDLGGDRAAVRPDAGRPVPRSRPDHRVPDPGVVRGDHARRAVAEVEVAGTPAGREPPGRPAQPGLRGRRARRLGEVLPLLRRRAADRAAGRGQVHDRPRRRGAAPGREHDRGGGRPRHHVHRPHGRHRRDQRAAAGRPREARPRHPAARRRRQRRVRLAVPLPGLAVGLPARAGALDQRLRPQVRPGLPRHRLAGLPRGGRTSPRTWSSTRTTSARPTPRSP